MKLETDAVEQLLDPAKVGGHEEAHAEQDARPISDDDWFEDIVTRGLVIGAALDRADDAGREARFAFGDLALELLAMGERGRANGAGCTVAELAVRVGRSAASMERYRRVAAAWPRDERCPTCPWSVHRLLVREAKADVDLHAEAHKRFGDRLTYDEAEELMWKRNLQVRSGVPEVTEGDENAGAARSGRDRRPLVGKLSPIDRVVQASLGYDWASSFGDPASLASLHLSATTSRLRRPDRWMVT